MSKCEQQRKLTSENGTERFKPDFPEIEYFDLYDSLRKLLGKVKQRGTPLEEGECKLVVYAWIVRGDGRILLTRRAPGKVYEGRWECTGGSVIAGEDSLDAALREVREETGLALPREKGRLVYSELQGQIFVDVYLFRHDFEDGDVRLCPRETCEWRTVTIETLRQMRAQRNLLPYYDSFFGRLEAELRGVGSHPAGNETMARKSRCPEFQR